MSSDPRASGAFGFRSGAALEYPFEAPRADGSVTEVAPGVLWVRIGMPIAPDHINAWLLRGYDGWTIVDTGLPDDETRVVWERIVAGALDGAPVQALVCTHFHSDHAGLAGWLTERFRVPLYMSLGEFQMLRMQDAAAETAPRPEERRFYARAGMPAERAERVFEDLRREPLVRPQPSRFRRLRGGDLLTIGPRRWRVIVGEGHSPEHVCLYCAEDGLLIGGDQLLPRITSNVVVNAFEPESNPLALWFESLDRLETCADDTLVLPSHQSAFRGLRVRVRQLRAHHRRQFEELKRVVAARGECTAFEAMSELFPLLRSPGEDRLALGETVAHLSWLRYRGVLERRLEADDAYRYGIAAVATNEAMHW